MTNSTRAAKTISSTPGPWVYDDENALVQSSDGCIAEVQYRSDAGGGEAEQDANGRLLAAAPALAHLLQFFVFDPDHADRSPERGTFRGEVLHLLSEITGQDHAQLPSVSFLSDPPTAARQPATKAENSLPPLGPTFLWVDAENPDGLPCTLLGYTNGGVAFRRGSDPKRWFRRQSEFDAMRREGIIRPDDGNRKDWWPVLLGCETEYLQQEAATKEERVARLQTLVRTVLGVEELPDVMEGTHPPALRMGDVTLSLDLGGFPDPSADELRATLSCLYCDSEWSRPIRSRADLGKLLHRRRTCNHGR